MLTRKPTSGSSPNGCCCCRGRPECEKIDLSCFAFSSHYVTKHYVICRLMPIKQQKVTLVWTVTLNRQVTHNIIAALLPEGLTTELHPVLWFNDLSHNGL